NNPIPLIEIDWLAYWEHFKALHGEHVEYEGKLLFPDGWRYSNVDPSGPEYPPENEEARQYWIKTYWQQRLEYCRKEYNELSDLYARLKQLAAVRSAPLYQREYRPTEDGFWVSETADSVPLDLEMLEGRMRWLKQDILQT